MKKVWIVLFAAAALVVLTVCGVPTASVAPDNLARAACKDEIVVGPSGDLSGATDRLAIQTALENCPPGGVVELEEGRYYIDRPVVLEGFMGTLSGSGMDETVIETADGFGPGNLRILFDNPMAIMFGFFWSMDRVTVKNLTMQSLNESASVPYESVFLEGETTTILANFLVIAAAAEGTAGLDVVCRNVRFIGADSDDPFGGGKNVNVPVAIAGGAPSFIDPDGVLGSDVPINGTVRNCRFVNAGGSAVLYYQGDGGSFKAWKNRFTDCGDGFFFLEGNEGCDIFLTRNTFRGTMSGYPTLVLPGTSVKLLLNNYRPLVACDGGCIATLLSSGNEVYEDLRRRPDLTVCGDPETNIIVTDYRGRTK